MKDILEFYIWTVFFAFIFYMVLYAGSDEDLDIHIAFKGIEIHPVVIFFIPFVNLLFMIYEWILIIEIFKGRRKK